MLLPSHVKSFHCKACGNCCFRNKKWEMYLPFDEETFFKAKKNGIEMILENVLEDKKENVRKLKCIEDKCALLNEERLCKVVFKYGYDYIPDACKTYPRLIGSSSQGLEISLFGGCRTVLEILMKQKKIVFTKESIADLVLPNRFSYQINADNEIRAKSIESYFIFRSKAIELLQNNKLPFSKRLFVLGEVVLEYMGLKTKKNYARERQEAIEMLSCFLQSEKHIKENDYGDVYFERLQEIAYLFSEKSLSLSEYFKKKEAYWDVLNEQYVHFLENYTVNFMLHNLFYLYGLAFGYVMLVLFVTGIMVFIVGLFAKRKELTEKEKIFLATEAIEKLFLGSFFLTQEKIKKQLAEKGEEKTVSQAISLVNLFL